MEVVSGRLRLSLWSREQVVRAQRHDRHSAIRASCKPGSRKPLPVRPARPSDEPRLLQIVIGLDDLAQLLLRRTVAAVAVGMVALDQFLEPGLDLLARRLSRQAQRLAATCAPAASACGWPLGSALGGWRPAMRRTARGLAGLGKPRRFRRPRLPSRVPLRPGVGANLPGRPVAGQGVLLEGLDVGVLHAVEVVVGRVVLADVVGAEEVELALAPRPLGARCSPAWRSPSTGSGGARSSGALRHGRSRRSGCGCMSKYFELSFMGPGV